MANLIEQIRLKYSGMGTEELTKLTKSGAITEEAHAIAIKELQSRNIDTTDFPEKPLHLSENNEISPGFFWRCWHGKEKLWKAYWLLGLLVVVIAGIINMFNPIMKVVFSILVLLPVEFLWVVSVWKCAFRSSHWAWAVLARAMAVLKAIPIIILGIFGQVAFISHALAMVSQ